MMMKEYRTAEMTASNPQMKLEGYALVFESPAQIGNSSEIISRGALDNCDMSDVALFFNHETGNIPLARTPNTLKLEIDERGLRFTATLPDTETARSVYESVKRGDMRGCSFAFKVADGGDNWQGNNRTIRSIEKIYECSVVTYPAYSDTSILARNQQKGNFEMENTNQNQDNQILGNNARQLFGVGSVETSGAVNFGDDILASKEYRRAFFKSLQGKSLSSTEETAMKTARAEFEKRANEFNTSTNSAALLPTSTLDEIISKARTQGGLLAECRAFSMPSKIAIPIATPADKAAWHVEGAAVESEKIVPTAVTFDGNEILKVFSISTKVQAMSISAFESYLVSELESCVMETISDAIVNGTGSGQGTGILTAFDSDNTVYTATTDTNIAYADIVRTVAKLKRGYANGAKFAMNNATLWNVFYRLSDDNQRPIFINDLQNEGIGKILGYPVVIDDYLPDNTVIFGNFSYMAYNLPAGIVIESSRESSFKSALIDYRALAIADCKPILPDAFVKLSKDRA